MIALKIKKKDLGLVWHKHNKKMELGSKEMYASSQ